VTRRIGLLAASLALHTAAMAPYEYGFAAWLCLVPLLLALDGLAPRRAFLVGLFWGTAQIWLVCHWTAPALAYYWQQPWWFGVAFLLVASAVFVGIYYGLFAVLLARMRARHEGPVFALLAAALWVAAEFGQARLLGGDPWMLLGYALVPHPLLTQAADLGGVFLLSFVIALVNGLVSEAWRCRYRRREAGTCLGLAVAVVAGLAAYGGMRLGSELPQGRTKRVAIVQGNHDPGKQWSSTGHGSGLDGYLRLTRKALLARPGLVVWPESAVTFFVAHEGMLGERIARLVRDAGVELIVGGPHADTTVAERPRYFNSAFHFGADGRITARYDKLHLLPFAEYFPLQTIALLRRHFERVRSFTPGEELRLLPTPLGPAAVSICFEGIFPNRVRAAMALGAGVLINLSNDAWLGAGAGPAQHLAMVSLRAIEHRSWLIRATTTGVSAIVDPRGRIVARTAESEEAILTADVAPLHVTTLYERIGDSFAWACVALALSAFAFSYRPESR
jgi:apolipoprotein N-acyltransferase